MRAQLEAELQQAWTRENLAVYADYLQSESDPRGEWIAMDLAMIRDGLDAATQQRREELLRTFKPGFSRMRYGWAELDFYHDVGANVGLFQQALRGPMGRYLRAVTIVASTTQLDRLLAALVVDEHPWLARCALGISDHARLGDELELAGFVKPATVRQLATLPALRVVELRDRRLRFSTLEHPNLPGGAIARDHANRVSPTKLEVQLGDTVVATIELGRMLRMHHGIVDELDALTRDAWAELRFAIEHLEDDLGRPLATGRAFPAAAIDRVIASAVEVPLYGADWRGLRDARAHEPGAQVLLRTV